MNHLANLCLFYFWGISLTLTLVCDTSCEDEYNDQCCYYVSEAPSECNRAHPAPAPPLAVNWYVNGEGLDSRIALNISWHDVVESGGHCGYSLCIMREGSAGCDDLFFRLKMPSNESSSPQFHQVTHQEYGLDATTLIEPGLNYYIILKALPPPKYDMMTYEYELQICSIPDCNDDENINRTSNCQNSNNQKNDQFFLVIEDAAVSFTHDEDYEAEPIDIASPDPASSLDSILVVSLFSGISGLLILVLAVLLCIRMVKKNVRVQNAAQRKIFVSISCEDADRSSWQSVAADQMCCFFQQHGREVTYTLWHSTQLTRTNSIQWVCDEMEKNDHVILVLTPRALQHSYQEVDLSETDPLLNRAYDPYRIVRKKMEAGGNNFSIVYFDPNLNIPPSLSCIKSCYQLPKDSFRLCRHLLACDVSASKLLERSLQNRCEEMLIDE